MLRGYGFKRIDINGQRVLSSSSPSSSDELFFALESLYDAEKGIINYQRGAIVELLTYKLVNSRCQDGDTKLHSNRQFFNEVRRSEITHVGFVPVNAPWYECWSNQCLDNQSGRYRSKQVDVIVLLEKKYQIEGYSCKIIFIQLNMLNSQISSIYQ